MPRPLATHAIRLWARRLLPLSICALLAWRFGFQALEPRSFEFRQVMEGYAAEGERLIHGVDSNRLIDRLPSAAVIAAICYGSHAAANARLELLFIAFLVLLAAAIEASLEIPVLFGLAPALAALYCRWEYPQAVMCLLVLIVAGFLVRYARAPCARNGLWLAFAIGSSFLFRSDLVLLPPAAAAAALFLWDPGPRRRAKHVLIPLLVPYLFTLPVLWVNYRAHHRFIPFESATGMFDDIAKAAVGLVHAGEPPLLEPFKGSRGPFLWAVGEISAHPARYLAGYLARLRLALAWCSPFLFFALGTLWTRRRSKAIQALGLLVAYWFAMYCAVAIDERYFEPVQAVLILLACGLVGELVSFCPPWARRWSPALLSAALAAFLAVDAYSAVQTLRGPRLTIDQACARSPKDWWLFERRGTERLGREDFSGAAADFARASALLPVEDADFLFARDLRLQRAAAELFDGRSRRVLELPLDSTREHAEPSLRTHLLLALAYSGSAPAGWVRDELNAAKSSWKQVCESSACPGGDAVDGLARFVGEALAGSWPPSVIARIEELLARAEPRSSLALIEEAEALTRSGRLAEANAALERATKRPLEAQGRERLAAARARAHAAAVDAWIKDASLAALNRAAASGPDPAQRRAISAAFSGMNDPKRALEQLEALGPTRDVDVLVDKALLYTALGRTREAAATLEQAAADRPSAEQRRRIARLEAQSAESAAHSAEQTAFANAKEVDAVIERARGHARRGEKDAARSDLKRAEEAQPRPEQRGAIAGVYSDLGDVQRALDALEALGETKDADVWIERARFRAKLGRAKEAFADLEKASALGLDSRQGARMAWVFQELHDYKRALPLLEKAAAERPDEPGLRASLGLCQYLAGATEQAVATLQDAIKANPRFLPPYLTLGYIYERRADFRGAVALYDRGLAETAGSTGDGTRRALASARDAAKRAAAK